MHRRFLLIGYGLEGVSEGAFEHTVLPDIAFTQFHGMGASPRPNFIHRKPCPRMSTHRTTRTLRRRPILPAAPSITTTTGTRVVPVQGFHGIASYFRALGVQHGYSSA